MRQDRSRGAAWTWAYSHPPSSIRWNQCWDRPAGCPARSCDCPGSCPSRSGSRRASWPMFARATGPARRAGQERPQAVRPLRITADAAKPKPGRPVLDGRDVGAVLDAPGARQRVAVLDLQERQHVLECQFTLGEARSDRHHFAAPHMQRAVRIQRRRGHRRHQARLSVAAGHRQRAFCSTRAERPRTNRRCQRSTANGSPACRPCVHVSPDRYSMIWFA